MSKNPIQGILVIRPNAERGAQAVHYFHRGKAPMDAEQLRAAHPEHFPGRPAMPDALHVQPLSPATVSAMRFLDACAEQGDAQARAEVNSVLAASRRWAQGSTARGPEGHDLDSVLTRPARASRGMNP